MAKSFTIPSLNKFENKKSIKNLYFVSFNRCGKNVPVNIAFPKQEIPNTLSEIISNNSLKQLKLSNKEKFAYLSYYFNGKKEDKNEKEEKILLSDPEINFSDQRLDISIKKHSNFISKIIKENNYHFIAANFSNLDQATNLLDFTETLKYLELIDKILKKICKQVLNKNGTLFITSSAGKLESMLDPHTGETKNDLTSNPVPFLAISNSLEGKKIGLEEAPGNDLNLIKPKHGLEAVAPSILKTLGLEIPPEFESNSII